MQQKAWWIHNQAQPRAPSSPHNSMVTMMLVSIQATAIIAMISKEGFMRNGNSIFQLFYEQDNIGFTE